MDGTGPMATLEKPAPTPDMLVKKVSTMCTSSRSRRLPIQNSVCGAKSTPFIST